DRDEHRDAIVSSSNQSQRGPSWSAYSRQPREAAIRSIPARSKSRRSDRLGLSISIVTHTTAATAKPGTMLTRKSQCQEKVSVKNPPSVGPSVEDKLSITEIIEMTLASCRPWNFV